VLKRSGIESVDALAAVTRSDNVNVVVGRMARDLYHVPRVVARVYNPRRIPIYEKFGLQTVASSSWGAQRIEQIILHPGLQSVFSAGNGRVGSMDLRAGEWNDHPLTDLLPERALQPRRWSVRMAISRRPTVSCKPRTSCTKRHIRRLAVLRQRL
jgi:trk system potassium uptake protein TrkA